MIRLNILQVVFVLLVSPFFSSQALARKLFAPPGQIRHPLTHSRLSRPPKAPTATPSIKKAPRLKDMSPSVLHVAAEIFPWVKVGGLADVIGTLPEAQRKLGIDARVIVPAYPALKQALDPHEVRGKFLDFMGTGWVSLLMAHTPAGVPLYLVDAPALFDRPGGPYEEYGDSCRRFGLLSAAAAALGRYGDDQGWTPEILHGHDWQAGLAPAYAALWGGKRPASVMTIHNLAYKGIYAPSTLHELWLPDHAFQREGVEFYGNLSFLKAGLQYADRITTVSPTYAKEIQTAEFGEGLQGLLASRGVTGILNGINTQEWDPASSPHLQTHYRVGSLAGKARGKAHLQQELGLTPSSNTPLFVVVSRLVEQKGLDLVLENIDHLVESGAQLAVLGSGESALEQGFQAAAAKYPGRVTIQTKYDESLAHRMIAGGDAIIIPSRYEPCGLTQLYALRSGTLPVVRKTGGLADTVIDTTPDTVAQKIATGFVFEPMSSWVLGETLGRACQMYQQNPRQWAQIRRNGMAQDFSWDVSAKHYLDLYQSLLKP